MARKQYGYSIRCKTCEYSQSCAEMDDDCVHDLEEVED